MRRAGRRPGTTETREAILVAARRLFAERGYDGTTIRSIAGEADVNPALVHHFFGTKDQVFVAALELPVDPRILVEEIATHPRAEAGERLVRAFLAIWRRPDLSAPFSALIRSATSSEQSAQMIRQFIERAVLGRVAAALDVPPTRMAAAAAQLFGLAIVRYIIRVEPMASASDDEVVQLVGPVIQRYVDGD